MATVGLSEEAAVDTLSGDLDIYTSSFRPMKNTVSGREEKTFMKIIVQAETDEVMQQLLQSTMTFQLLPRISQAHAPHPQNLIVKRHHERLLWCQRPLPCAPSCCLELKTAHLLLSHFSTGPLFLKAM